MVAAMIIVDNPGSDENAYWPIMHAKWNGWTPADFIFPSFLFLVGISLVYSFDARRQRGETNKQILWHAFKRSLILIAVGLLVNASPIYGLDLHTWRFEGVTQRIGLCYFLAAILELWTGRRGQLLAISRAACLAIGPCCVLFLCPAPAFPAGTFLSWTKCRISLPGSTENCLWVIFTTGPATRRESFTRFPQSERR